MAEPARPEGFRAAFGQRRKTLANALHGLLDADRIAAAGIDPRKRAEQLEPAAFVALAAAARVPENPRP